MHRYTKISLAATSLLAAGGIALAANGASGNNALAITRAKIPLTQAVTAAEQHVNGRAARAEFENSRQGWVYDIEVISGSKVFDVKVDADKGTVLSSVEDKEDQDDEHDEKD